VGSFREAAENPATGKTGARTGARIPARTGTTGPADPESGHIKAVLMENDWDIARTARALNMTQQVLQYKINKFKIIEKQ